MTLAEDFRLLVGTKIDDTKLQAQLDALKQKTITITPIVSTGGTKEVKTLVDNMGNLVKTTTEFDSAGKKVTSTISQFAEKTQKAEKHTKSLGEAFVANTKKVAQFALSTALIGGFTSSVYKAVEAVKEFDGAMTDFRKVSDLSGGDLEEYADKLGVLGESVYRSKTEMLGAATVFKQGGYTDEESANLAKTASLFQNIADTEISAADSASMIISQLKAFNLTTADSVTIVDSINEVDELASEQLYRLKDWEISDRGKTVYNILNRIRRDYRTYMETYMLKSFLNCYN